MKRFYTFLLTTLFAFAFVNGYSQAPTIASFSPESGPINTTITITGTNFSTTPSNNIVFFGAIKAVVTAASATQLTITVPAGATYQPISVLVGGFTAFSSKPFIVTFGDGGVIDACSFATKFDVTTGSEPYSVAIGDLDGDGKPDMVVANQLSNTVSVFKNISTTGSLTTGSFANKVDLITGLNPYFVAIQDLDGDGKPELIVINDNSDNVSIYKNIATQGVINTGSFASRVNFATGENPWNATIADFDLDGKPDLAIVNDVSNTISVLRNTSSSGTIDATSFAPKVDFVTGTFPIGIASGDLDGDGKADIVVTNQTDNSISIFRNKSVIGSITTSSFDAKVDFAVGLSPYSVTIGDLDADGKPEVVVVNNNSATLSILSNNSTPGTITLSSKVDFDSGTGPLTVALNDMDGDGKVDLVVANGGNRISVLKNQITSSPITTSSFSPRVDFISTSNPYGLAIGDLDGNGKPDIAATNYNGTTASILRNTVSSLPMFTSSSFDPMSGSVGTTVTLTGTNFSTTPLNNTIKFNGVPAVVTASTSTTITVVVPSGATTGAISIEIGCVKAISIVAFTVTGTLQPTITSFSPASGPVGTSVTISGTNFSATPANNVVQFNGTTAIVTSSTTTSITTTVPLGATTGTTSVNVAGNIATSPTNFIVTTAAVGAPGLEWANAQVGSLDTFSESMTTDPSGNIYTIGEFSETTDFDPGTGVFNLTSAGNSDIYVSKQNAQGELLWAFRLGSTTQDAGRSITTDATGNVYVAGFHSADVDFDPGAGNTTLTGPGNFLCKYNPNGNLIWATSLTTNLSGPWSMIIDTNQDLCIATSFSGTIDVDPGSSVVNLISAGSTDICLIKLNLNGGFIWANRIGSTLADVATNLAIDASGNFHITGHFNGTVDFDPGAGTASLTSAGGNDIFIAKLSSAGNYTWARRVGNTSSDTGYGIAVDNGGNVLITGGFQNTVDFDPEAGTSNLTAFGSQDIYVLKLNATGSFVWAKNVGGINFDIGVSVKTDGNGNVFYTGFYRSIADFDPGAGTFNLVTGNNSQVFVSKLDASGNFVWALNTQGATAVAEDPILSINPSGDLIIAGIIDGGTIDFDPGICVVDLTATFVGSFIIKLSLTAGSNCGSNLTIKKQPSSSSVCKGASATFTIAASGTTNITYQWQKLAGTTFNNLDDDTNYSGTTSPTLTINTANDFGSGDYRCEVSGDNVTAIFSDTVTLTLNMNIALPQITPNGSTLTASPGSGYQWLYYDEPISGATNQSLDINIFEYGVYAVNVTLNGCTARSQDFVYLITANEMFQAEWKIYPNPFTSQLYIEPPSSGEIEIDVIDVLGRSVKRFSNPNSNFILLDDLKNGTYFLNIQSGKQQSKHFKITKTH